MLNPITLMMLNGQKFHWPRGFKRPNRKREKLVDDVIYYGLMFATVFAIIAATILVIGIVMHGLEYQRVYDTALELIEAQDAINKDGSTANYAVFREKWDAWMEVTDTEIYMDAWRDYYDHRYR